MSYPIVKGIGIVYDGIYHPNGDTIMADTEWQSRVKNLLKGELKRRGISYKELAQRLADLDVHETERNINNKISRGGFTAVFFIQCLVAMEVRQLHLD